MSEKTDDKAIKLLMNSINRIGKKKDKEDYDQQDIKIGMLGDMKALDVPVISSGSLALDMALGVGGYPRGRIIEVIAPESAGKTTLALTAIAEAQKLGDTCAFIDVEHTLDVSYCKALGVNVEELIFSQPDDGDEAMRIIDRLINSGLVSLIVTDSVAALVRAVEMEGEATDNQIGQQARLMSQTLKRFTITCGKTGTILFFTNQIRNKIGGYGNPEVASGGNALKYYASIRLDIRRGEPIKDGEDVIGAQTKVKVIKNKVAVPFKTAVFNLMYGTGIDRDADIINTAINLGIVERAGVTYSFNGEKLAVGLDRTVEAIKDKPELFPLIRQRTLEKLKQPVTGIVAKEEVEEE